ncbi:uncharacterized protein HMPREF1541_07113 [Cyphellophora europaea CBS 101466]|uniref:NmrA-like domain-containing protein n=1 Tax=Cyphellophora europaea (strain CBS 101466) TaxID=1220924 RepID=W2RLV8_CYPE1|nr:uncharacterized protein HMPREF1541_07113 [Cyphellophora europaea CBS 101466]ETN37491.1 hypothetical protein HMPREF1541_07113 [Cyphellophora europaea CBS 101466]
MSSPPIKTVMVVGASGNTGVHIVDSLLAAGFTVSALTRETSKTTFADNVQVVKSDYTIPSLTRAFQGQDAVVSTIATFSVTEQIKIIDAMIAAGVKRFIPSEYGIDTSDPRIMELLPPAGEKARIIGYLKTKEGKISWTGVINGGYFDWVLIGGGMGWNLRTRSVKVHDSGDQLWEGTNIGQIANAVTACLSTEHYDETSNTYIYINSFTVSQNQVIAELEKALGSKLEIQRVNGAQVAEAAREEMAKGEFENVAGSPYIKGTVDLITCEVFNLDGLNNFSATRGLWNDRLGLPKESLEDTIRRVVKAIA